jgi:hypothetical protein
MCSCVVEPRAWSSSDLSRSQRKALRVLERDFLEDGATSKQWLDACAAAKVCEERNFYNLKAPLVKKGYVDQIGQSRGARFVLAVSGRQALASAGEEEDA